LSVDREDLALILRVITLHAGMLGEDRLSNAAMRLVDRWGQLSDEENSAERARTIALGMKVSTILSEHHVTKES